MKPDKPRILMVIPRGEAVRNFLYTKTLPLLSEQAEVYLLSVIHDEKFTAQFSDYVKEVIPLKKYQENQLLGYLRNLLIHAHYRWQWTKKAQNKWEMMDYQSQGGWQKLRFLLWKALVFVLANPTAINLMAKIEDSLSWRLRPTRELDAHLQRIQPDLVFNTSHVNAEAGDLPMRVARHLGFATAAFVFSWDNLTSRSRIMVDYDHYLMWNEEMKDQLLHIYPHINSSQISVLGTPQFDYHFNQKYFLSREALCKEIGLDPNRKYILYTTGMAGDFPEEHLHVKTVISILQEIPHQDRPQLVVRAYVKGNSPEMEALAKQDIPDVIFPPVLWEPTWFTPQYKDAYIYTNLLRHAALGINPASTVSLELMMFQKPVINIGYNPPGSNLPDWYRWVRHIEYEHYQPVVKSGGVMVAYSVEDMRRFIYLLLEKPEILQSKQATFLKKMFGNTLDGGAGARVATTLINFVKDK